MADKLCVTMLKDSILVAARAKWNWRLVNFLLYSVPVTERDTLGIQTKVYESQSWVLNSNIGFKFTITGF